MRLFDSHAHYSDRRFEEEFDGGGRGARTFQTLVEGKGEGGELVVRVYNKLPKKLQN